MYRKPIRTYERKKGGPHWHPSGSTSTITREDIPADKKLQPLEFKAFKDSDDSLEYDPFDTTFDRLARDAIVHPIPRDQVSTASYSDSSSDVLRDKNVSSDDDSMISAPFVSPEATSKSKVVKKRRNNKRQKLGDQSTIVTKKTLTRDAKKRGKKSTSSDQNIEPNIIEFNEIENTGGKKNTTRKKGLPRKHSIVDETTTTSAREGEKCNKMDDSRVLKRCSVSLKRLSLDKSVNFTNQRIYESKKIRLDSSIAKNSSVIEESSQASLDNDRAADPIDFDDESIVVEPRKIEEKPESKRFKNPIVSLSRLSLPKRSLVRNFSSSTPISTRATKEKSLFRLSPITNDVYENNGETSDLVTASLPRKSIVQAVDSVSANSTTSLSLKSSERKIEVPRKRSSGILSITPDPEPSGLLFDDTEIVRDKSIFPILENPTEVTDDATVDTPAMVFGRESSDHESLHLSYDDNDGDDEFPSKNLSNDDVETMKFPASEASISNENRVEKMDTNNDPFMGFSEVQMDVSKDETTNDKSTCTDDEWSTVSGSFNVTSSNVISESRGNVEQLSSGENTSSDEIADFVSASDLSNSRVDSGEKDSFVNADGSSKVETPDSTTRDVESFKEKDSNGDNRRVFEPVVLLSRLYGSHRAIANIEATKNPRNEGFSDTPEETTIANELSSKSMESETVSEIEESQIEMDSLRVDETSENMSEIEKSSILKIPEQDLSKYSTDFSTELSANTSDGTLKSAELKKIEELPGEIGENSKSPELREARAKKSEAMNICDDHFSRENDRSSSIQPVVLLTRLNDPFRITRRRNKYRDLDLKLNAIFESNVEKTLTTVEEDTETGKIPDTPRIDDIPEKVSGESGRKLSRESSRVSPQIAISQATTESCETSSFTTPYNESLRDDKVVYLKPGKSWARSLSILNQVHTREDLEFLAVGKGKKWRESVQSLLEMQQQGLVQSCVKKNEDDKESRSFVGLRNSTVWIPGSSQPDTSRLFGVSSPGRFIRRVSIRVVPDCKSFEHIKDTSFLEAYGITPNENRETIAPRRTLIAQRKTLEVIPKSLNSVKPRDVVLAQCGQQTSLPFDECYPKSYLENCRKIGEGVYGEVFLYEKNSERNVIKIIPIEGDMKINSERQKKFDEILSEIVIAKELHNLRFGDRSNTSSFVEVKNIRCVMGKYPKTLIDLWRTFDDEKNSENDCPSIFEENQLYIVLELGHGGEDLEAFVFQNAAETHALFMQTALALAVAEEFLEFEHRDLHWGNVLISRTDESQVDFKLNGKPISVRSKGVKVSVIDFTLSRMSYQSCSIFNDLSMDDDLFVAQGEYQFEIYRLMRQKLENNWQKFEPFTNILWLHYILDKMITAVRYRRKNTKIHKNSIVKLQELKNEILDYKSAVDFVTNCDKATRLQGSRSSITTVVSST